MTQPKNIPPFEFRIPHSKSTPRACLFACAVAMIVCSQGFSQTQTGSVTKSFTQPIEQSIVASSQSGVVMRVEVKEGDRVFAGETLAKLNHNVLLESRRIAIAKTESTARLDAAQARLKLLEGQKETMESLIDGGHINRYEYEQKLTEYENALAEYKLVEDDMRLAKLEVQKIDAEIGDRVIKSPINGFVTVIHKRLGEHLSISEPQYATVVQLDRLKVRFYLDKDSLYNLQVGSIVDVLVGRESKPRKANVIFVSPIIDPDSGTGRVEVSLDNSNLELRSGIVCYLKSQNSKQTSPTNTASETWKLNR